MHTNKQSESFSLLDERIRRWVWEQNWTELRDVQEEAAPHILAGDCDVIISAGTAAGKTEAAFLPICSKLLEVGNEDVCVLYVGPLKALINDQFSRIGLMCERLDIDVHPWHGDISAGIKKRFLSKPSGILLITPESLEALFVNHGGAVAGLFKNLAYIVVDELHSFIGTERGTQLQSLLRRIEVATGKSAPRIGLSATLGDMGIAAEALRHGGGGAVRIVESKGEGQELRVVVRGYITKDPRFSSSYIYGESKNEHEEDELEEISTRQKISRDIFDELRGRCNLIFTNKKADVEDYSDALARLCEEEGVAREFFPHHGNLSKELRESAEAAIKDKSRPVSVVCTSTLEMGIDIGAVESVAHIGVAHSVSSLRQRLGRSGRRGGPAILRMYINEVEIEDMTPPELCLRFDLVQAAALVRLVAEGWCEPPDPGGLHLSTLVQQALSLIAQYGGATAEQMWKILCGDGPFSSVTEEMFAALLRGMGEKKLITQCSDGLLLHGAAGERIVNHYSFYAAFSTKEEYRVIAGANTIGSIPFNPDAKDGDMMIFGGVRWLIKKIDNNKKVIDVERAKGGVPPRFSDIAPPVHDRVRREMFRIFCEDAALPFLDRTASSALEESREYFRRFKLEKSPVLQYAKDTLLFLWRGNKVVDTVRDTLNISGVYATDFGEGICVQDIAPKALQEVIQSMLDKGMPDTEELLGEGTRFLEKEKFDVFLAPELLRNGYGAANYDITGAKAALEEILGRMKGCEYVALPWF